MAKTKTSVGTSKVALPANYEEVLHADINAFKNRLAISESNRIAVTQQGDFKVPVSGGEPIKVKTVTGIIVDFAARKNYYSSSFDRDNLTPPDCFAIGFVAHDNLLPDEESPNIQHEACRGCVQNKWDKDSKGNWIVPNCRSSYRLALLAPDDNGEGRLMTLDLSSTATREFDKYIRSLASVQKAPYNVVTEFYFDSSRDYPSVRCREFGEVPRNAMGFILSTRDEALTLVTRKPNLEGFEEKKAVAAVKKLPSPRGRVKRAT